ncbi:MAG: iron-sulfur cluster assembly scaffold protein [Candidatus Moranbacteria bacterium]|nr:iron-sulfur cluster assembly scaffold protein [Candidatus Moranbacteria bacterium]
MSDIYQEIIMDHYRNPRCHGTIKQLTHQSTALNESCGDRLQMDMIVKNDMIEAVRFSGVGCAISQASASLLSEYVEGKSTKEALALEPKEALTLLGVTLSPSRIKCGLLALETLKKTLHTPRDESATVSS